MYPDDITELSRYLLELGRKKNLLVTTAESCTGGQIAGALVTIDGASLVFERGFVTYSNEAKSECLGIAFDLIESFGAVSEEIAWAMAEGAIANSRADVSVSVTGVAGPGGGTPDKPVGLVHMAAARKGHKILHQRHIFAGLDRAGVQEATVRAALQLMITQMEAD